jgi:hypothetical protein
MINFKKGPALSLHQVNYIGKAKTDEGVVAGMVVRLHDTGAGAVEVLKGASTSPAPTTDIYGFAINNQDAGDVIESGVIGVYALDGASVIETDQFVGSATSYTLGALVTAETNTGKIKLSSNSSDKIIGQVEGTRTIPGRVQTVNGVKIQGVTTVVGVKLLS